MDDLRLSRDVQDLVKREEDAELLLVLAGIKLLQELLENAICLLRVLLEVLVKLDGGLFLDLMHFGFQADPDLGELVIL